MSTPWQWLAHTTTYPCRIAQGEFLAAQSTDIRKFAQMKYNLVQSLRQNDGVALCDEVVDQLLAISEPLGPR
jgi:hypothetical protein